MYCGLPYSVNHTFDKAYNCTGKSPTIIFDKQSQCPTLHKGAFCEFPFRWIYYYGSNEFTGKETGKTHLCVVVKVTLRFECPKWNSNLEIYLICTHRKKKICNFISYLKWSVQGSNSATQAGKQNMTFQSAKSNNNSFHLIFHLSTY